MEISIEFYNRIAEISIKKFASLPKTGKPNNHEWIVMSTIVEYDNITDQLEVISLGTGSKCIGANAMSPNGDILNDSHAEVICRRAFIKYIYNEINNALLTAKSDIFILNQLGDEPGKFTIKPEITFHFFSTHVPCGDASIFPKNINEDFGACLAKDVEESTTTDDEEPSKKKVKMNSDIFRTGAKCLKEDIQQDPKNSGNDYHILGVVRTKPGRGDPTLSVSCSDKMTKWTLLGIQGALLIKLLNNPIYLSSITIAGGVPFSEEAMKRAICERAEKSLNLPEFNFSNFSYHPPKICQSTHNFDYTKEESKQPCPSSIIWFKNCKKVEVAVDGRKQGVTKKNKNTKAGRLTICKKELYADFYAIIKRYSNKIDVNTSDYSYLDWKSKDCQQFQYSYLWSKLKKHIFMVWPCKNLNLLLFTHTD